MERNVLLICPGFSLLNVLQQANLDPTATKVTFEEAGGQTATFPVADVLSGKVSLAYQANGVPLPRKHGFPPPVVAEDCYGGEWVKYVSKIRVEKG